MTDDCRLTTVPASSSANGARFGRIRMATLEASPAISAALSDSPNAKKIAVVQNAAAGTSLIGDTSIASTAGLVASSHAAPRPIHGDPSFRPIANVIQTSSAPVSGVTQNIARCPAMVFAAAIINDSPGAVTGTNAVPFIEGRYPCGANVQIAFGHGAKEAIGTGIFSLE